MNRIFVIAPMTFAAISMTACGSSMRTNVRSEWSAYDDKELKQEKSGVIVELADQKDLPAYFFGEIQGCDDKGEAMFNEVKNLDGKVVERKPVMVPANFVDPKTQVFRQFTITNNTGKVIHMNQVVLRLKDPSGDAQKPLDKNDIIQEFEGRFACLPQGKIKATEGKFLSKAKLFDRNAEIVPGESWSGWVGFRPNSSEMPGMWTFSVYSVPVELDAAGAVKRVENFDMRTKLKLFKETFKDGKLVSSKEMNEEGEAGK